MMHHVPQAGLTVLSVAGPVERGVRHQRGNWRTFCIWTLTTLGAVLRYYPSSRGTPHRRPSPGSLHSADRLAGQARIVDCCL